MLEELKDKIAPTVSMVMRTPRSLDLEITARCNLRCRYCYFFNNPAVEYRDLPTEEWLKFFDELGSLGVMNVSLAGGELFIRDEKLHENQETLKIADLIELGRHVEQELAPKTRLKIFFDHPHAFRALHRLVDGDGCGTCGIFGILGVLASGHYALCGIGETVPDLVFGEVGKDSLEVVWRENDLLKTLREGLPARLEGVCSRCLMRGRCLGSCIAQNYYSKGSLWAPYWFCEQAEEAGLFPASRLAIRSTPSPINTIGNGVT